MKRTAALTILGILLASVASAQYAASASGSPTAAAEINGKLNHQEGAGAPGFQTCTVGKDVYTNTTNGDIYWCTGTNTWTLKGATGAQGSTGATGASGSGTGTLNSGSNPQMAQYVGAGSTVVGGVTISGDASVANGGALTIAANAVNSGKMAVVNTRRTCIIVIGADNGMALGTADIAPQGRQCFITSAAHVVEITVAADAGTPAVVVAKNHAGALTDLHASLATASAGGLACANAAGSGVGIDAATTCGVQVTTTTLAAGDWLETHTSASASTAKRLSIAVTYTVD